MDNLLEEYKNTEFNPDSFLKDHEDTIKLFFNRGAKVEILGDSSFDDGPYSIQFIDRRSGKTLCENKINKNHWLSVNEKYYIDWHIKVFQEDKLKIVALIRIVQEIKNSKGEKRAAAITRQDILELFGVAEAEYLFPIRMTEEIRAFSQASKHIAEQMNEMAPQLEEIEQAFQAQKQTQRQQTDTGKAKQTNSHTQITSDIQT